VFNRDEFNDHSEDTIADSEKKEFSKNNKKEDIHNEMHMKRGPGKSRKLFTEKPGLLKIYV